MAVQLDWWCGLMGKGLFVGRKQQKSAGCMAQCWLLSAYNGLFC